MAGHVTLAAGVAKPLGLLEAADAADLVPLGELVPGARLDVRGTLEAAAGDDRDAFLVSCPAPLRIAATGLSDPGAVVLQAFDESGASLPDVGPGGLVAWEVARPTLLRVIVRLSEGSAATYDLALEGLAPVVPPAPPDDGSTPPTPGPEDGMEFVPGHALVLPRPGAEETARSEIEASGGRVIDAVPGGPLLVDLGLPEGLEPDEAIRRTRARIADLSQSASLAYAEPNAIRRPMADPPDSEPDDPLYALQWHYPLIRLPEAWAVTTGSDDVIVAVIDTGITAHPDLLGRIAAGYDFIADPSSAGDGDGRDPDPTDEGDGGFLGTSSWHGTHVAGTVGAASDNGTGVVGVTWHGLVMPVRALGKGGGTDFDLANAILFAAGLPNASGTLPARAANVVNMSIGGAGATQTLGGAVSQARAAGLVLVAASGNGGGSDPSYPAAFDGVVAVGSVDRLKNVTSYSNHGPWLDLVAPGGDTHGPGDGVYSTLHNDAGDAIYGWFVGTSMASPHVAGVAALIFAVNPDLTPAQVESILAWSAEDLGPPGSDEQYGYGLLDAYAAVAMAASGDDPPPPPPPPGGERIYVLALDADTSAPVAEARLVAGGSLSFVLEGLPAGRYLLAAGTDRDGDGDVSNDVEAFGMWPDASSPQEIVLGLREARGGLDFSLVDGAGTGVPGGTRVLRAKAGP
jgi:serine protease